MAMLVLALLLVAGGAGAEQTWAEQPSSVMVNPGAEAVLACRVDSLEGDCR